MPPSKPEMVTWSARALATPAATVPTPTSETSFTETSACRVDVLQVEDELRQVLDRIDVVMRRRRDQADARRRMAHLGDHRVDLVAGQLAAFAGLGALRHLDLHHVGVDEIFGRHAEAARGDLLDRRAHRVAVRQRLEAVGLLAAFAGVGLAADAVHGDGERRVRLAADRAEGHGAGREALARCPSPARPRRAASARGRPRRVLKRNRPRMVSSCSVCSLTSCANALVRVLRIAAHGVLQRRRPSSGVQACASPRMR